MSGSGGVKADQQPDGLWLRQHQCGRPCSRVLCRVLAGLKPAKARRSAWFSRSLSGSDRRGQGRPKARRSAWSKGRRSAWSKGRRSAWSKARRSALFSRSVSGSGVVKAGKSQTVSLVKSQTVSFVLAFCTRLWRCQGRPKARRSAHSFACLFCLLAFRRCPVKLFS